MDKSQINQELKRAEGNGKAGHPYQLYQDSRGYWSIGWGFCIDPKLGMMLPPPVAEFWLNYLIDRKIELAQHQNWSWFAHIGDARQNVIICLIYNMGMERLLGFKRMLSALECGDYDNAADELEHSDWFAELDPHPDDGYERGYRMVRILRSNVWE